MVQPLRPYALLLLALVLAPLVAPAQQPLWRTGDLLFPDAWAGASANPAELALLAGHELWIDDARVVGRSGNDGGYVGLQAVYRSRPFSIGARFQPRRRYAVYAAVAPRPYGLALWVEQGREAVALSQEDPRQGLRWGLGAGWAGPEGHRAWLWWFLGPQPRHHLVRLGYRVPLGDAWGLVEIDDRFEPEQGDFDLTLSYGIERNAGEVRRRYALVFDPGMTDEGFGFHLTGRFSVDAPLWRSNYRLVATGGVQTRAWWRYAGRHRGLRLSVRSARFGNLFEARWGRTVLRFTLPGLDLGLSGDDLRLGWRIGFRALIRWP
ncbi:hypothetical protein [Oceanithermus sp.]|uniref:hypothetical protein n=1 Tax=Oceanithermus sp. TaxID=2268145 RepID=UPI00257CE935|nr:hypothetical protein [Oceanithermus sp.]